MGRQIDIHSGLIDRCRQNDRRAQAEIYGLYSKAMYNVSLRIVGSREDAEDVLQESFVSAFRNVSSFRQESSFGSWLKRIVVNRSLNAIRSKVYMTEVEEEHLGEEREEDEEDTPSYTVADVRQAMHQLPEGYRAVFSLYMFEDYSHKEIAEALGVSENTSKSQLNRAKKKLKELIIADQDEQRQA